MKTLRARTNGTSRVLMITYFIWAKQWALTAVCKGDRDICDLLAFKMIHIYTGSIVSITFLQYLSINYKT